jgi:hypothetical protein
VSHYYYKAFGLTFRSCIEHPDFISENEIADPDCIISYGAVPQKLKGPFNTEGVFQITPTRYLLNIDKIGRYLIENGKKITIEKAPGASERELLLFLWASAIAALLHQRGIIIVHSSAINLGGHAVIFSGRSGSGKSTIASTFATQKNARIISDDISAIYLNESGIPMVLPGYPLVKLWRDASEKLEIEWDETNLIRESVNKMIVNVSDRFEKNAVPLRQIYFLSYHNSGPALISEITGYKKLELLMGKIFRKKFVRKMKPGTTDVFLEASRILPQIRLCTLQRQHGMAILDETTGIIEIDLKQAGIP